MTTYPSRARTAAIALLTLAACAEPPTADAYGNFEADEVVVSAETAGQLRHFAPTEGAQLDSGTTIAIIDTVQLVLEHDRLAAERKALLARRREATQQAGALRAQQAVATRSWQRAERLAAADAGTAAQVDQAERDVRALDVQLVSSRAAVERSIDDVAALDARMAQVRDRLTRAVVRAPISGTVLATYVRTGEVIQPGQPLVRVADLRTLTLRAYITGDQLTRVTLGQQVTVRTGANEGNPSATGTISWVAAKAEFTPTPIQTRDERAELVYAIKVRVPNTDGVFKIGMPADVTLAAQPAAAR
jgi:HlyD family secretion protein